MEMETENTFGEIDPDNPYIYYCKECMVEVEFNEERLVKDGDCERVRCPICNKEFIVSLYDDGSNSEHLAARAYFPNEGEKIYPGLLKVINYITEMSFQEKGIVLMAVKRNCFEEARKILKPYYKNIIKSERLRNFLSIHNLLVC